MLSQRAIGSLATTTSGQEPDHAREIFFLFDYEASGKLNNENFYKALLAGGAKLNESEFNSTVVADFGSTPTLVVFKQALQKAKSRDETFESLRAKFASFGDSVSVEALRYIVTVSQTDRLGDEDCEELIKLVDPEGTGLVNVDDFCHKLIPH